ncbi:prenyltransferase/squalene oxidase repeat-containing protein [Isosphaeraceae bacterium EP7]
MESIRRRTILGLGLAAVAGWEAGLGRVSAFGASPAQDAGASSAKIGELNRRGVEFLRPRQASDGSWSADRKEPGITALVIAGLLRSRLVTPAEPFVVKGLAYLEQFVTAKGGLSDVNHANYATSIGLIAFQEANVGGKYDKVIKDGQNFLKTMQWDETEGKASADPFYGGAGYGGKSNRPDLSNTTFMLEALHDTGLPADDPAFQKALVFVSRCQNLKSEFNDQEWAGKVNDGGFIYTAANGGTSVAGKDDQGGLRSYASMTYAGLKSMIYAGLTKDDARVRAAVQYLKSNYTLDENPGLGQKGLYYYYQVFGKTMAALEQESFVDANGASHDWRADLVDALAKRQAANGSWVNANDLFMEGDPNLVTAYALLALAQARPKA